jgi:hypothetical protein
MGTGRDTGRAQLVRQRVFVLEAKRDRRPTISFGTSARSQRVTVTVAMIYGQPVHGKITYKARSPRGIQVELLLIVHTYRL